MKRLVKFSVHWGRGYSVQGIYVYNESEWNLINKLIEEKKEIYFGEICGKHSEVTVTLEKCYFKVLSENQAFIEEYAQCVGDFGYNPLEFYEEEIEGDEEDEDEGEFD